jgi:hypothetical protein
LESISQLVENSLARHGVPANFDHLRLQWSNWFRCESSFSVLLAPTKPGILALGEEIVPPAESVELRAPSPVGKRMLALFQISDTDDLGMALGRLFLPGNPLRERLEAERCFARYAVIEDPIQRQTAAEVFKRWMLESSETASGIGTCGAGAPARDSVVSGTASTSSGQGLARESVSSKSESSTSFAWGMAVQKREVSEVKRPQPLPNGF